ncbi:MAG: serine protease Do [Planctomycetota bacterium]|jgi:serine protease Do
MRASQSRSETPMLHASVALLSLVALPQDLTTEEAYRELESIDRVTPVVRVVQAVKPTVVFIETEAREAVRSGFWGMVQRKTSGSGSGVVVHPTGYVVTNYHVVQGSEKIHVSFDDRKGRYEAQLVSYVSSEDLALLKIESKTDEPFPTVRLGQSSDLFPGERVVAIGNPMGQTHTVSQGIISGLHRDVEIPERGLAFKDLIQTDASINFGNSGGPLLNIHGELIGINTAVNREAENIGFAIPVDRLDQVLTDILFPMARKTWLGFDVADGNPLVVNKVWPGSPAAMAGICEGDHVLGLEGKALESVDDFVHASLELEPYQDVQLSIGSSDGQAKVEIASWDKLDGLLFERFGITVQEIVVGRNSWVVIDRVRSDGPGDQLGLVSHDWIPAIQVPGQPFPYQIRNRRALAQLAEKLPSGTRLEVDIYRDDNDNRTYDREELYKGPLVVQ